MSDTAKLSVTLKAGQGFDSPWVVVHADTPAEAQAILSEIAQIGLGTQASNAAKQLQAEYSAASLGTVQVSSAPAPQQVSQVAAPAVAPLQIVQEPVAGAAPSYHPGAAPSCHHGVKVYREAKPGSGKTWKGWFCPSPQGTADQCKPAFTN